MSKDNLKMALIQQFELTDDEILEMESEYHGDIISYLHDKGFIYEDI